MRHLLFVACIATIISLKAEPSDFRPGTHAYLRQHTLNYSQRDYGDTINPQNWAITQDQQGMLYFGNSARVLQFDGINWSSTRIPLSGVYVTALHASDDGIVYVGANGEFGYLYTTQRGKKKYVSLSDSLELEDSFFSNIWRIFEYQNQMVFFAQEAIYFWDKKEHIKVLYPNTSFHLAFVENQKLFVRQRAYGLMVYENNELQAVPNGDIFEEYGLFAIFKTHTDQYLLISQEIGCFSMSLNGEEAGIFPLESPYTDFLNGSAIIGGAKLHDGHFALNTLSRGVIIINDKAEIIQIIDQNTGLRDNEVNQVLQDRNQRLWLSLNTGISMVNYNAGISFYDHTSGLWGITQSIETHQNNLYVGTSTGLFSKNKKTDERVFKHFEQIEGQAFDIRQLLSLDSMLLLGTPEGLFSLNEEKDIQLVTSRDASNLHWSEKFRLLFIAGDHGLYALDPQLDWKEVIYLDRIPLTNPVGIAEMVHADNNFIELWLGSLQQGVTQVRIDRNNNYSFHQHSGTQTGLEQGWVKTFPFKDKVYFGVASGLMEFIADTTTTLDQFRQFPPIPTGYFNYTDLGTKDSLAVVHLLHKHGRVWATLDNTVYYGQDLQALDHQPFVSLRPGRIYQMHPTATHILWLATDDGIIKINTKRPRDYHIAPDIFISRVSTPRDSIMLTYPDKTRETSSIVLPYSSNGIKFDFASSFYENGKQAQYSHYLGGFEEDWSEWSILHTREYINLKEGDYVFHIKAKDIYGNESEVLVFEFRILPPWYRTLWAYVLYVLGGIILVLIIVKLSIMRLKAQNIQLEKLIAKRTEEIRKQKDEIAGQHKLLLKQKEEITSSIRYASRIQNALVPGEDKLKEYMPDSFIFWLPRDIVSGDFYWMKGNEPYLSLVAADCTGHGVPGAFMSMLGIAFLNQLAERESSDNVSQVLEELRKQVKTTLGQTGSRAEQKDGMDLAFCTLNIDTQKLYFSGANNPLWLFRSGELTEYKGTRNPIGIYRKEKPFELHEIDLQKNDMIYLFSDGYVDQFGGPDGKCFGKAAFREFLHSIHQLPAEEQKSLLQQQLDEWMGEENRQLDDILVVGFRI